jgi:uncharacterized protein
MQANKRSGTRALLRVAVAALGVSLVAELPAKAQFWGGWGNWGRPQPQQRAPQPYNPFGNFFGPAPPPVARERQEPADFSHAPGPQKKPDPSAANVIAVVGDGMADWLAYGLEDALAENPEFAVLRRHRTTSGLIRYDLRRDIEWPQVIRETIAVDKPKFIVMMIGINDRQQIRERPAAPASAPANAPARAGAPGKPPRVDPSPADLELQARESAEQQNAEHEESPESRPPAPTNSGEPRGKEGALGPFEFHSEKWEAAYVKRIDTAITALKSAGVPVFWVGLPAQRNPRASSDSAYLNELFRQEAEKAAIGYVDVWDGFVDEAGRYSPQGPDFEGQIRRLRAGDGIYFTRAGARKLAHYVEREIQRALANRAAPVALPLEPAPGAPGTKPGGSAARPLAGPVVPLTVSPNAGDELLGSARGERPGAADPVAARVLTRGEPLAPPGGRADDFSWPRPATPASSAPTAAAVPPADARSSSSPAKQPAVAATPAAKDRATATPTTKGQPTIAEQPKGQTRTGSRASEGQAEPADQPAPVRRIRPRANPSATPPPTDGAPRPPLPIRPSAGL